MTSQIKPKEQKILQKTQALISSNDAVAAKETLLTYLQKNKPSQYTRYYLGLSYAILGEFDEALKFATSIVKKYADNLEYLKLLGGTYHGLQQYDRAIDTFNRALKIDNNDIQTLSNIASAYKETHHFAEAETYYKKSLAIQENQPDALTNYGLLMQSNAQLDDAILLHKKAIQLAPNHHTALYNLAYALNEKGDSETSLQVYNKVLESAPNHIRALCDVAHILGKLKQHEQALPFLQQALQIAPNDEHIHLNFGNTYRMLERFDQAETSFNEVIKINPNNLNAKYYLAIMKGDNSVTSSPDDYVQQLFDGYAETFDEQLIDQLQYKTPELIGDMVKKHTDESSKYKILDLGCGTGLAGIYLQSISETMIGVDLSEKMIKKAQLRNIYDDLVVSGISQYFETHDYQTDIIVSADVFVYIGDIADIFNSASKSLQTNGIFVFSTEDTQEAEQFLLRDSGRFAHNENYIRNLASKNGLNLIDNEKTIIRYESNEPIHGQVYLLRKL